MNKRNFLKKTATLGAGLVVAPSIIISCKDATTQSKAVTNTIPKISSPFTLPSLPYGYDAFPQAIDQLTMEIHHSKHHQGYINKLNKALENESLTVDTLEELLVKSNLSTALRNNGGGHYNHSLFWEILTPGGSISKTMENALKSNFNTLEAFYAELIDAGLKQFGSGWAWLCQDSDKKLFISNTPNQDNPLMSVAERKGTPLLGIDVWEHAYYLKYQNKRGDYLNTIVNLINWTKVESRMV